MAEKVERGTKVKRASGMISKLVRRIGQDPELIQPVGYATGSGVISDEEILIACETENIKSFLNLADEVARRFGGNIGQGRMWLKGKVTNYIKLSNPDLARAVASNLRSIFDGTSNHMELATRLMAGLTDSEAVELGPSPDRPNPSFSVALPDEALMKSVFRMVNLLTKDADNRV